MGSRILTYTIVCGLLVFFLRREDARGVFAEFDRAYLGWLSGNSGHFAAEPDVTFIGIRKDDGSPGGSLYDGWPPSALDFALMLENIAEFSPPVLAVGPALRWEGGDPLTTEILAEKSRHFQNLILGAVLQNDATLANGERTRPGPGSDPTTVEEATAETSVPPDGEEPAEEPRGRGTTGRGSPGAPPFLTIPLANVTGRRDGIPRFTRALVVPHAEVTDAAHVQVVFTDVDLGDAKPDTDGSGLSVPLVARNGDQVVASLALGALIAHSGVSADDVTIALGREVRIGDRFTAPVDSRGALHVDPEVRAGVRYVAADDLFMDPADAAVTGGIGTRTALEEIRHGVSVLGVEPSSFHGGDGRRPAGAWTPSEVAAMAVATMQMAHFPELLGRKTQFIVWGGLWLIGCLLLATCGRRALLIGFLLLVGYATASLLLYEETHVWFPLPIPASILLASVVLATLLPNHRAHAG